VLGRWNVTSTTCVWLVLFRQIFGAGCAFQAPEQTRSLGRQRRQTLFRLNMYKDVHSVCWPVAAGVVCCAVVPAAAPERVQLEQTAASPGHGRGPCRCVQVAGQADKQAQAVMLCLVAHFR